MSNWDQFRRLSPFFRPHAPALAGLFLLTMLATLSGLAQPMLTKVLIDDALLRPNLNILAIAAGAMVGFTLLGFVLNILTSYHYSRISALILFEMRQALFAHLCRLSPRFFAKTRTGDLVSRLNGDVAEAQRVFGDTLLSAVSNLLFFVVSLVLMATLHKGLLLASLVVLPPVWWTARHFRTRLATDVKDMREQSAGIGSFLIESTIGLRQIVLSTAESTIQQRFRKLQQHFLDSMLRMQRSSYFAGALPAALLAVSSAVIFLLGGWLVYRGEITLGALMAFLAYQARLFSPVQNLMSVAADVTSARVSLDRVFELFQTQPEVAEPQHPRALGNGDVVEVENLTFVHSDRQPVLSGLSFEARRGEICVIAGPSGSGKSTLCDLLVRLYDPMHGAVRIGGIDIREVRPIELRRAVALVEQTPFFFHSSISENLAVAAPEATPGEIRDVLRLAGIDEFVFSLPEGLATVIGERGLCLSAGERQRLAIARALLRKPSVMVLDEPSAALDAAAEAHLCRTLADLAQRCVVIVTTHRPAILAYASRVITLGVSLDECVPASSTAE